MKNVSALRSIVTGLTTFALAFVVGGMSVAESQTVTAVSAQDSLRIDLKPQLGVVSFVTSDASSAREAAQNAVISAAEGKVIVAIASRTLPIPVIGAVPVEAALHVLGKLRKPTVKGFDIEYIQGLSSETVLQRGAASFGVPAEALQEASPVLLRIRPSAKDAARIVRSLHVAVKMTNGQVNPTSVRVLGTDQETIQCYLESGTAGDIVLTTRSPLESGEYAIVLAPNQASAANALSGIVWDFKVQ